MVQGSFFRDENNVITSVLEDGSVALPAKYKYSSYLLFGNGTIPGPNFSEIYVQCITYRKFEICLVIRLSLPCVVLPCMCESAQPEKLTQ